MLKHLVFLCDSAVEGACLGHTSVQTFLTVGERGVRQAVGRAPACPPTGTAGRFPLRRRRHDENAFLFSVKRLETEAPCGLFCLSDFNALHREFSTSTVSKTPKT